MAYIGDSAIEIEPVETDNIGSLARLVLSELPACSDLVVRQQLGYALREFCKETDACVCKCFWKFCEGSPAPRGRRGFNVVNVPGGMDVQTVLNVRVDGHNEPFSVIDGPVLMVVVPRWHSGRDMVEIGFSVCPKVGGEDCPKWFKDRYAEAITAGAMYHLLSMTGKGWSDPQRAAQYAATYQEAIADAAYRRACGSPVSGAPASAVPCGGLFM